MRWGIVGAGLHAEQRIVPALARTGNERLAGIVASSEAKGREFAERIGGTRVYPDLDAMLGDPAIDAVFITTPNDRHHSETLHAAAARKHVLVEKPMALTEAEASEMVAACAAAGVRLGVGFQCRHHPVHREMQRRIAAGDLGELVMLRGEWHTAYGPWQNWRADVRRAGSDILAAVGVHVLDLLCWFAGSPLAGVEAIVDRDPATGRDQTIVATLRFANGTLAQASMTRRAAWPQNSVFAFGSKLSLSGLGTLGMNPAGRLLAAQGGQTSESTREVGDLYAHQFEAFAAAVERGEEPNAGGADGLVSVRLAERILAADRRKVEG